MMYYICIYAFETYQASSRWSQEFRFCNNDNTSFYRRSGVGLSWLNNCSIDRFLVPKFYAFGNMSFVRIIINHLLGEVE